MKVKESRLNAVLGVTLGVGIAVGFTVGMLVGRASVKEQTTPTLSYRVEVKIEQPKTSDTEEIAIEYPTYYNVPLDYGLQDHIRELCEEMGVPMSLVMAVINVESSFDPTLVSGTDDYGLMQINACNHEWLTEEHGITDFLDPYQNVYCGILILSEHYNRYEDVNKALMAYNLGATGAKKLWDKGIYETRYTRKVNEALEEYVNESEQ